MQDAEICGSRTKLYSVVCPAGCLRSGEGTPEPLRPPDPTCWTKPYLYHAGTVRAVGICDVDEGLLQELLEQELRPHIVQNWMDVFQQDRRMRERCREEGIL